MILARTQLANYQAAAKASSYEAVLGPSWNRNAYKNGCTVGQAMHSLWLKSRSDRRSEAGQQVVQLPCFPPAQGLPPLQFSVKLMDPSFW